MAVPEIAHIVLPETTVGKNPEERWFEVLRRWLVQCPQCSEVRLVVGANENDQYVCKDCRHSFTITFPAVTREHELTESEDYQV